MATKIKLTCETCKGEVVYDKETHVDDEAAHKKLHAADCEFMKSRDKMWWAAEHGLPVKGEVLEEAAVPA